MISFIATEINAQQTTFTKVFYDPAGEVQAYSIVKTYDNNYMIAGQHNYSGLVIKLGPSGDIIWEKNYTSDNYEEFYNIIATNDSCFVIAGYYGTSWTYSRDLLCMKINANGDIIWSKRIDLGKDEVAMSVQQTSDSGYILTGFAWQSANPNILIVIVKLTSTGGLDWAKTYDAGTQFNHAYSVSETADGGYAVAGDMENDSPFTDNALIMKLSPSGDVTWAYKNEVDSLYSSTGYGVIVKNNGLLWSVMKAGYLVILKTDYSGNILWSKRQYIFEGEDYEMPRPNLKPTTDNGYIFVSGGFFSNLVKLDSAGNSLWNRSLFLMPSDVIETTDRGYLAIGNGPLPGSIITETFNPQIGIIKTDSVGQSISCISDEFPYTENDTTILTPITIITANAGNEFSLQHSIVNVNLSADTGCVAAWDKVPGIKGKESLITIIPNPNNGNFQVVYDELPSQEIRSIEIFNSIGQKIFQTYDRVIKGYHIHLSSCPSGLYFLKVALTDRTYSEKFIIDR